MTAQSTLGAFTESGWDVVEDDYEGRTPGTCPDCGAEMVNHYWPIEATDVAVHGMGCECCQTIVPHPPPAETSLSPTVERVTVTARSGASLDVGAIEGGASA